MLVGYVSSKEKVRISGGNDQPPTGTVGLPGGEDLDYQ